LNNLRDKISQGLGVEKADIVLKGGRVFDLITGNYLDGDVAICGDTIVGTCDNYKGKQIIDVTNSILVPGFIDTHLHIESSMVTPFEFERCVLPLGVTTAICDPHEIANVVGSEGVKYFQESSERTIMDIFVQLSSCVPSTSMETSGASINSSDLKHLQGHVSNIGLSEMMNYPGVINCDDEIIKKLELFAGGHIDGHAPQLSGKDLNAYIAAGIKTEHEATSKLEALEKLQKGMRVLIREGSVSKDLMSLYTIINDKTSPYICFCTDDRNPLDIDEYGHIDFMIRTLIKMGVSPLNAYRSASLSASEAFGLNDRGIIAPGKKADIVILENLEECKAKSVICGGKVVDEKLFSTVKRIEPIGLNSVKCKTLKKSDFISKDKTKKTSIIGIIEGKIITEHLHDEIPIVNGDKSPDTLKDLVRVSVIERHGKNNNIANGFVRGFGLKKGAVASTVAHDHHNIVSIGIDYVCR
jgi:adenine deaminase